MARGIVITYPKCPLATTVSIFGSATAITGLYMIVEDLTASLICIGIGAALLWWASVLANRKRFKLWVKNLQQKGVLFGLPASAELCAQVYQANPGKKTLRLIAKYNPLAAQQIAATVKK